MEQSQLRGNLTFSRFLTLPYMIAVGMGLHNLGEGLAIGASYANGEWVLSGILVAGFALHNGTEGFGIVGAAGRKTIDWKEIVLLGAIAGVPTCVGTLLSGGAPSPYATIVFYTLAAGSLLYVILSLTTIAYTATRRLQVAFGVFLGVSFMYISAMVLSLVSGIRS
jgi:ZIP family zinc transporter